MSLYFISMYFMFVLSYVSDFILFYFIYSILYFTAFYFFI